jgi:Lar family restriction alleviation protein
MTEENKLLPCPFCGEEAKLREYFDGYTNILTYSVECTGYETCGARSRERKFGAKRTATVAWNRRTGTEQATTKEAINEVMICHDMTQ